MPRVSFFQMDPLLWLARVSRRMVGEAHTPAACPLCTESVEQICRTQSRRRTGPATLRARRGAVARPVILNIGQARPFSAAAAGWYWPGAAKSFSLARNSGLRSEAESELPGSPSCVHCAAAAASILSAGVPNFRGAGVTGTQRAHLRVWGLGAGA